VCVALASCHHEEGTHLPPAVGASPTPVTTVAGTPPGGRITTGDASAPPAPVLKYPEARAGTAVDEYHGVAVSDPYRWLEDPDSPATRRWIDEQNALTRSYLDAIPGRALIEKRLIELWNYERYGIPEQRGGRYFYTENDGLRNQPVLYVMDHPDAPPRVLFDPNPLSADGTVGLAFAVPSVDGRRVAYGLTTSGSDWTEVRVRDVKTLRDLPDRLSNIKFTRPAWRTDGSGFFYSRFPEPRPGEPSAITNFFNKLYFHRVGTPQSDDTLVYESSDHKEWMFEPTVSEDGRYLVVTVSKSTDESRLVLLAELSKQVPKAATFEQVVSTFDAAYDFLGNRGNRLWFRTTLGAPKGRIVRIDAAHPEQGFLEVVPEARDRLEDVSWVGDRLIATYLRDARSEVRVFDLEGKFQHTLRLPGIGTVHGFSGRQGDRETFFSFGSFATPTTIYRCDPRVDTGVPFRTPRLTFDPGRYRTEQVFVPSTDGTRIPVFLTSRLGDVRTGKAPTYLYGYGGFDISLTPGFDPATLAWMEMGGLYAVANIRGGGEYGRAWHEAGKRGKKQQVFEDFLAVARWLVSAGYTRRDRLAIGGRSNGGLLVGACITQHPELFGAALPAVGVMDMLRYHRFTIGWAWADEYGTSDNEADFRTLLSYSPLHNVRPGLRYPATLVTTSDHDDRVVPAHSFKFAAALQSAQGGTAPILIRIETQAGHGLATPTTKLISEQTDRWTFLVRALDFVPWPEDVPPAASITP
jgi:prolyl oligopeptidase